MEPVAVQPVVVLPFHQDERLADDSIPLSPHVPVVVVDPVLPDGDRWQRLRVEYDLLADEVAVRLARRGAGPGTTTVLSGDCLALLGTLAGCRRAGLDPAVVWFDAHGDVHTLASSTSGYLGGMVLRMVVGGDPERLTGPLGLAPLPPERAVLVDARDLDPAEVDYLAAAGLRRIGVPEVVGEAMPPGALLVHVDLDVIDAAEVPGMRFPADGGPSTAAVLAAVARLLATGRVVALDVACPWHEAADPDQQQGRRHLLSDLLALSSPGAR